MMASSALALALAEALEGVTAALLLADAASLGVSPEPPKPMRSAVIKTTEAVSAPATIQVRRCDLRKGGRASVSAPMVAGLSDAKCGEGIEIGPVSIMPGRSLCGPAA